MKREKRAGPHCHLLLPGAQTHQRIVGCTPFTQGAVWFRKTKNESRAEAQGQLKAFNVLHSRREPRLPQPTRVPAKPLPHPTTQRPQRVTTECAHTHFLLGHLEGRWGRDHCPSL